MFRYDKEEYVKRQKVVGVCGCARTGKDSVGNVLVEHYGFRRIAFADKIKEVATLLELPVRVDGVGTLSYGDAIASFGEETVKKKSNIRPVTVMLGQVMRNTLGIDVWVDPLIREIRNNPEQNFVVTDVRQKNESEALGYHCHADIWRIRRPGFGPADSVEEMTVAQVVHDLVIENDGSLDDLKNKVIGLL